MEKLYQPHPSSLSPTYCGSAIPCRGRDGEAPLFWGARVIHLRHLQLILRLGLPKEE